MDTDFQTNIKRQINDIAALYDWDMEVNTTDPEFYKWTQWIFLKLFKAGKYSEADILNMKTEEMLDLPNVSIKEIKVICAIKEAVKKHTLYSYLGGKQDER